MVVKQFGFVESKYFLKLQFFLALTTSFNVVVFFLGIGNAPLIFFVGQALMFIAAITSMLYAVPNPLDWWYFFYQAEELPCDSTKAEEITIWLKRYKIRRCILIGDDLLGKPIKIIFLRKRDAMYYKLAWL